MNNKTRKRGSVGNPALIFLHNKEDDDEDLKDIPKLSVINCKKFTVGRSASSNLKIMRKCISRLHCSLVYHEKMHKWMVLSHINTRKAVSVQGRALQEKEAAILQCGDTIKVTPFFAFQFKCSNECECSVKKIKLSRIELKEDPFKNPQPSCSYHTAEPVDLIYQLKHENEKFTEEIKKREEVKNELEAKIRALEQELQAVKGDNAHLLSDICSTVDELTKIKEEKIKEKNDTVKSISSSGTKNSTCLLPPEIIFKMFTSITNTESDIIALRKIAVNSGAIHDIFLFLGKFSHFSEPVPATSLRKMGGAKSSTKSRQYWAKGTGYASGNTAQNWNVEQALCKQRSEEEHVIILLNILSSFINPNCKLKNEDFSPAKSTPLPVEFEELVRNSCLLPVLASYLRNDSVLDMARHIPLYRAILLLLRVMALNSQMVKFLLPKTTISIIDFLRKMKSCVDTYSSMLMKNKIAQSDRDLSDFIGDVRTTTKIVEVMTQKIPTMSSCVGLQSPQKPSAPASIEQVYLRVMKELQFGTYDMISENSENNGYKFNVSYHYERNARADGEKNRPARVRRLAQETASLDSMLPLSYSSSVFVRCDTDRLDVMKVLIIGPDETPYANGCFEFDVYFPANYPNSPMLINLETTGKGSVRFNPNLYNDGKVCLSVLNTWSGRPEEKWNAQTSSLLQVLVSIQSLILVPDPYFNEPGYEKCRGTAAGNQSSKDYNANIMQATVRWAILEQLRNPSPCFKEIIHTHFWLKRSEIIEQITNWIKEVPGANSMKTDLEAVSRLLVNLERPKGIAPNEVALSEPITRSSTSTVATPSTSGAVRPSTSAAVRPSTSAAVRPSTSAAVRPSTSAAVRPSTSAAVRPSTSAAVRPSTSAVAGPSTSAWYKVALPSTSTSGIFPKK